MKLSRLIFLLLILSLAGYWLTRYLFPNNEQQIRALLQDLAETASIQTKESDLVRMANANQLLNFFTTNAVIRLDTDEHSLRIDGNRNELRLALQMGRARLKSLRVQFLDVKIGLSDDQKSATAHMTALADINGEKNAVAQELKMLLRKVHGDWQIARIETVQPFY